MHTVDSTAVAELLSTFSEHLDRIHKQLAAQNLLLLRLVEREDSMKSTRIRESEAIGLIPQFAGNTTRIAEQLNLPRKTVASWPEYQRCRAVWLAEHPRQAKRAGNLNFDPSDGG